MVSEVFFAAPQFRAMCCPSYSVLLVNIHCKCKWSDTFLRCCNHSHKRFYCVLLFVLLVNIHCKGKWTISEGRTLTKVTLSTGKNAWRDAFWEKGALEYPSTSHNINVNMRHGVWRDYRNCAVTLVRCPRSPLAISDSRNEVTFTAHNGPLWDSGGGLRSPLQPTQLTKDHSIWRQKPLHIEGSRSGI